LDFFYVGLAFSATFLLSTSLVLGKIVFMDIKNPIHALVFQLTLHFSILVILSLAALILGYPMVKNLTLTNVSFIVLSAALFFLGLVSMYLGILKGKVSAGGIIMSSRVILSSLLAYIFLNEHFHLQAYLWIALVVVGVMLVSWEPELKIKEILVGENAGSLYYFGTIVCFAIGNSFIRLLNNQIFLVTHLLLRLGVMLILALVTYPYLNKILGNNKSLVKLVSRRENFIKLSVYALLIIISDFGMTTALGESLTVTETIAALEGLFVFLIMLMFSLLPTYRESLAENLERKTLVMKSIGVILATWGIIIFI